ncbi:hypothetical protein [Streptomyces sp. NPDC056491]|uniref:hypothetical protein n=1 Tax=Streptomyces sp. NPDC056491 TaxID=3345837 RepID=UPI003683A7F7
MLAALVSGSLVLGGRICTCITTAGTRMWETACTDPAATAERQEAANEAARKRAAAKAKAAAARRRKRADDGEDDDDDDDGELTAEQLAAITAPPVVMVRRDKGDALAVLGLGGLLSAAGVYAGAQTAGPMIADLVGGNGSMIVCGGALVWAVAAWMVSPPPEAAEAEDVEEGFEDPEGGFGEFEEDDVEEGQEAAPPAVHPGAALLWHVIRDLSDAEFSKRAGVHLDVLLDSAVASGLLPQDTEQTKFRQWLEAAGIPTVEKLGMRIEGKPVTRAGARVDAFTAAHGYSPTALLQNTPAAGTRTPAGDPVPARGETPLSTRPAAPVPAQGEAPASTPAAAAVPARREAPAAAFLTLIPGGLSAPALAPSQTPSPAPFQEGAQEGR